MKKIEVVFNVPVVRPQTQFLVEGYHVPVINTVQDSYTCFLEVKEEFTTQDIFIAITDLLDESEFILAADNKTAFKASSVIDFEFKEVKETEPQPEPAQDEVTAAPTPEFPNMQQFIEMAQQAQAQQQQNEIQEDEK